MLALIVKPEIDLLFLKANMNFLKRPGQSNPIIQTSFFSAILNMTLTSNSQENINDITFASPSAKDDID